MKKNISALHIVSRITAASVGGYIFTYGLSAFFIALAVVIGAAFDQAQMGFMMLAILVYLAAFLWAFSSKNLTKVWLILFGGGGIMVVAALGLQSLNLAGS
jgi:hypothetical protein